MTDTTSKSSTLIVVAPRSLTKDQRATIVDMIRPELPSGTGVVLLDAGFSVMTIGAPLTAAK